KKYLERLDEIAKKGLDRIYDFQHSDGGWGWWKEGESDHYMTAYVIWGLTLAHEAGLDPRVDVAERGAQWLDLELVEEEENYDRQAWMLHALAVYRASFPARVNQPIPEHQAKALDNLWKNRDRLNAYTRALLTLAANAYGDKEKAQTLIQNLANGVKKDNAPDTSILVKEGVSSNESVIGTAHWGEDGVYWRWSDGGVEATAFALRAMMAVDPKNPLVEPTMNWLVKNRRGAQWSNTRDTAIVVLAMNDYLRASGELSADVEYELSVNGNSVASKKITAADVLNAPSLFPIDLKNIKDGANEIRIVRRGGESPIYFSAAARFFSLEEPIKAAGNEIFVRRTYYKISNKPTLLKGFVSERSRLRDGGKIASGDRVETLITVETKNNYEYLLFEDLKPAGLEATQIQSGQSLNAAELKSKSLDERLGAGEKDTGLRDPGDYTGRTRWVYQELRDRKVALFLDKLPQGVWEMRYEMRAEAPGEFHALPVIGHAMYVPEIRCNGEEMRVKVVE
ncbi:alpha-2-macroglobulin, partial [Candidatus Sumerlaeota bacterium]|nr:alpha-2-macroglobulin [Candidatus Sumerlaeota bacterium]